MVGGWGVGEGGRNGRIVLLSGLGLDGEMV